MKKLDIRIYLVGLLITLFIISCQGKWNRSGYINPDNKYEYIVNDSISIIGEKCKLYGYEYNVYLHGKKLPILSTFQSSHKDEKGVIRTMNWRYKRYIEQGNGVFFTLTNK